MNEVVVTGYSVASPIGNSIAEFSERLFMGDSGVVDIRGSLVEEDFPVPYAALLSDTLGMPAVGDLNYNAESDIVLDHLFKNTLREFNGGGSFDGIIVGAGQGGTSPMGILNSVRDGSLDSRNARDFHWEITQSSFAGLNFADVIYEYNTCITGATILGHAMQRIRSGRWRRAIVTAVEPRVRPWSLMALHSLGALSTAPVPAATASRPFSKSRAGFVKGEGAAMMLLESRESAERRGAKVLGSVVGFGQTSDQWRLTDGRDDGKGAIRAMSGALNDAGIDKSFIGYINAHGTSTPMNDKLETQAIKNVFGAGSYKIPVSSLKSQIGHSNAACGLIEAIATLIMLQKQVVAPTINYIEPDPDCDLDYVPNRARDFNFQYALSNSFGFGGANACLVLKGSRT